MIAFLKLIPIKDWLYIALATVLLGGFIGYTVHERHVGAAKEIAAVTKVATRAEEQVQEVTVTAQKEEVVNAKTYDVAVAAAPVRGVGIVCQRAGGRQVPAADAVSTPGAGEQSSDGPVGPPFDPSGSVLTRGRDADAQIAYLQARIHELEKQMEDSP